MDKELRILMLEDSPADAELEEHEFKKSGLVFTLKVVDTREAFLKELDEFSPNLILSDYDLPSFDGLAALRIVKEKYPDVPFILVTGKVGEEFAIENLKEGATDYVLKNNLKRLVPSVKRALEEAKQIAERKRAEEELIKSELRFRYCFDLPLIGFAITSTEKGWIEVNDRICSILGYSRDEIVRKTWSELTHPDDLAIDIEQFNLVLSGQIKKYSIDKRFIRKDGEIVWTSISVGCVRKPDGRVDYIIGLMEDITERKQNEEALRESEERYRKQFEEAIDAIFLADPGTGMLVDCNIAASKLVEREKSEIIGKHQSFLHPAVDVKDEFSKTFKSHVTGDSSELLEDRVITKSGQIKDVAIRASKITIEGKEVMQGIFRDITERKRAEKELNNLSRQNELILNSAIEGILGLDVNGNHTFVNSAAAQMFGYRVKELIGKHSHKIWHHTRAKGGLYPEEECPIYAVCKYGTIQRVKDEVFWRKDRTSFPVAYTGTPIVEGGKIIGAVVTFRDITKRKREEEELRKHRQHLKELVEERTAELKKTNEALQIINSELNAEIQVRERIQNALELSEDRYKKMVAAVTSYTYSVQVRKGNAIYTEHSIGCLPITGYNPDELKSDPNLWYSMIYPDDKMVVEETIKEIMAGNKVLPIEHRIMRRDGAIIWIRNTIVPYYNDDEALVHYEGLIENITERKLAEEEIQKLNKELEKRVIEVIEANKELEAFNHSVSHDLQIPLMVIGGFARRYLKVYGDTLDTNEIDMISTIQMSAQKMEQLIKDLLAFSRSGRQEIKPVQIDMENLVSAVLEELNPMVEGRTISFDVKELSPAYGDISLIKQVLVNLISNAVKFTQSKDIAVIEVGNRVEENKNIYYVRDNGIGFDSRQADKLFAPFNRLPEAMKFDGTGIGLSIVERIINRHGGQVWAEGSANEGATFYFTIPNKA